MSTGKQDNFEFVVDNEVKHEFLDRQKKSTKKFYGYILLRVDEFEQELGKKVYDFNIEDRDELLLVKFKNTTVWAFQTNLSCLKNYVDFCIGKNLVRHNENRFSAILPKDYENYVSNQAIDNFYMSKAEVKELEGKLLNSQDQLILELLGCWGVRGRTEKGNTLEEMINLRVKDVKPDDKLIYLYNNDGEFRYIEVDDYAINLIQKTIDEDFYIFNNGYEMKRNSAQGRPINETEYVFRLPGKNKFSKVDDQFFTRRIQHMQKWLERPYLTISNLYFSAMIDYAKQLKEQHGELTKEDYIKINERFQYGETGEKYWYKTRDMVKMYV